MKKNSRGRPTALTVQPSVVQDQKMNFVGEEKPDEGASLATICRVHPHKTTLTGGEAEEHPTIAHDIPLLDRRETTHPFLRKMRRQDRILKLPQEYMERE